MVRQLKPESILDVGVGFGKWGHLFREYTDIIMSEENPKRYSRENWLVRIDGIEGFESYITPMHRYLYNEIFIGDMCERIRDVPTYDVVFLGDVIEHVEQDAGRQLLEQCLLHANKAVIVTTPAKETHQNAKCANELEIHRSLWSEPDFHAFGRCITRIVENDILVAALLKDGVRRPVCESFVAVPSGPIHRLWRQVKSCLRPLKPLLVKLRLLNIANGPFQSGSYWEDRYATGDDSGLGSYDELARYKAQIINEFVREKQVDSVVDFGCGDGNQLQ